MSDERLLPPRARLPLGAKRRREAYRLILALITDGKLEAGDRLPSETEMATQFGMSRPIIREALSELQNAGVVKVRHGAGAFVQSRGLEQSADADLSFGPVSSLADVRHCFEFRAAVEGDAAALAAQRRSDAAVLAAQEALDRLDRAIDNESLGEDASFQFNADFEFHRAIAVAAGNPYFERVLLRLKRPIDFTIGLSRSLSLTFPADRLRLVQREHVRVLDAIRAGKPDDARDAMRTHIMNATRRVFEGPSGEEPS